MNTRKTTVSFETFNDGLVSVHLIDDDGNAGQIRGKFRYAEKTVGAARYYEAMTAKMQVDRLIRIQYQEWLTTEYLAVIRGRVYEISQVQMIPDSLPKTSALSLHLARQREVADGIL